MTELAFYDMDRTITRYGTYTPWLVFFAWKRAPWRLLLLPLAGVAGLGYALKILSRKRVKEINHYLLMGRHVPRAVLAPLADAFAAWIVDRLTYPQAKAQIAADKAAGRRVVLATASNAYYVEAIARRLGIEDVIATASLWREDDRLRWRIAGENNYAAGKLALVKAWLEKNGLTRDAVKIRFYSDHHSDRPVFEWADERFATNPNAKLLALATAQGWQVLDWRR